MRVFFFYNRIMSVNKRIKQLRTALKLTQTSFAKAIHISNGYIADMELSNRKVNDRIIHLISLTFGVNETWLKNGTGNMFFTTSAEKLQRMIALFNQLSPKLQDYVMVQIEQLLAVMEEQ